MKTDYFYVRFLARGANYFELSVFNENMHLNERYVTFKKVLQFTCILIFSLIIGKGPPFPPLGF